MCMEEGMATHSSVLAWRILWTEEPGVLQSMGLQARRSTQSILKETNHKYSLEGLMLKLKPSTLAKGLMRKD